MSRLPPRVALAPIAAFALSGCIGEGHTATRIFDLEGQRRSCGGHLYVGGSWAENRQLAFDEDCARSVRAQGFREVQTTTTKPKAAPRGQSVLSKWLKTKGMLR